MAASTTTDGTDRPELLRIENATVASDGPHPAHRAGRRRPGRGPVPVLERLRPRDAGEEF